VSIEEQYVALPKLYGAPAYARPTGSRTEAPRPFDPDELPIEAAMTDEDREIAENLRRSNAAAADGSNGPSLTARPFSIRGLAGRILKQDESRV
jgi:hypothetical protein